VVNIYFGHIYDEFENDHPEVAFRLQPKTGSKHNESQLYIKNMLKLRELELIWPWHGLLKIERLADFF